MTRLFINWYEPQDNARKAEVEHALNLNIKLPFIDSVVNLSDTEPPIWAKSQISHVAFEGRPTFKDFFYTINQIADSDDISIIANLDIYFDNTLMFSRDIKHNQCYALTRYNVSGNGPVFFNRADSQDVWIFKGSLPDHLDVGFCMGYLGCDGRLAYLLSENNYQMVNPSKSIITYHLHQSEERSYINEKGEETGRIAPPYLDIAPSELT